MLETITMPKTYTNTEVAELMGCSPEYVRKLKSTRKDELEGLWEVSDKETYWSEEGLNVLASMMSTSQAKSFCAGQLARRTQEAIAITRSEINEEAIAISDDQSNLYQNDIDRASTRTSQETPVYSINNGRYSRMPEQLADAVSDRMVTTEDAIGRMDRRVALNLLKAANLSETGIDLDALFG